MRFLLKSIISVLLLSSIVSAAPYPVPINNLDWSSIQGNWYIVGYFNFNETLPGASCWTWNIDVTQYQPTGTIDQEYTSDQLHQSETLDLTFTGTTIWHVSNGPDLYWLAIDSSDSPQWALIGAAEADQAWWISRDENAASDIIYDNLNVLVEEGYPISSTSLNTNWYIYHNGGC